MTRANDIVNVLLIEDDEDDYFITRRLLSQAQVIECDLTWVRTYDEGLEAVLSEPHDVALIDYQLGTRNGLELLREANEQGCSMPMILLTGHGDLEVDLSAMEAGAADYLSKDEIDGPLLERTIRYARERKEAEERIRKQATLLDKARDAIIAYDMDGQVVYWNKSAERLTGWSADEMLGETARDYLYDDDERDKLQKCWADIESTDEWTGELRQQTRDGDEIVVESRWTLVRRDDGTPESVLVINTDITERKRLESQFLRSQRMESVGRLVSGIAHDLGNLLVPITLGVKVLEQRHDGDDKTLRTLSMIKNSAERGSDMVDQVLAFARGVEGERVSVAPETIINEVRSITDETFPDNIDVAAHVEDDLQSIVGDATQIQQVLMNLCVNARDAMPEGGSLTIRAENVILDDQDARLNIEAEPGPYVSIAVSDTGVGMPDDVVDKVFEPFFSTKSEDKGTGLGLSTVYSIVKSHDGFIDIQSEKGVGTTFRVYLPVDEEEIGEDTTEDPAEPAIRRSNGREDRVLVVDNEANILEMTHETLRNAGYQVVTAPGGEEALERLATHSIDVMVTDLMMPNLDGFELIQTARERYPNLPIIAASGLADGRSDEALDAGAQTFLSKPFTADKLERAIESALRVEDEAVQS